MSESPGTAGKRVVVIGASMAGLLAASTLANHFDDVVLMERDAFPEPGENRKGVPQGKHTHLLLELGRQTIEDCLPGLTDELTSAGAVTIPDVSSNVRWYHRGTHHRPGVSGLSGLAVSRPTLEALVRRRVLALPNVRAIQECDVVQPVPAGDKRRVTGVRFIRRRAGHTEATMLADLVVDAGGRGSRSPGWLEELGYERPRVEEIRIDMGYSTCYYRRRPDHIPGLEAIAVLTVPPERRMGVLLAQDGNRWVLTVGGYLGDHAPTDPRGFREAARSLPAPEIRSVLENAEPLGEPVAYKFSANLRRHYEELADFPEGYLVVGDALCSFNPIYGQGMTVAALEAVALGECLAKGQRALAKRFFARASQIIDVSWSAAVGSDVGFPEVEGPRTPLARFLNWYVDKLHTAAYSDATVSIAFLKVINMVAPPPSILHPHIVWRVVKGNLWPDRHKGGLVEQEAAPQAKSAVVKQAG